MKNYVVSARQLCLAAFACLPFLAGCAGGGGSSTATTPSSPGSGTTPAAPLTIAAVSPTDVPVGSADVSLVVNGTGFANGAVVSVNNVAETTTYVSATQLKANVPAAQMTVGAVLSVRVNSGSASITADPGTTALSIDNPVPSLASISPAAVALGTADTTVTVTGANFVPGVALAVNGTTRTSTYISPTQMTAQLTASDFAAAAPLLLNVINPKPGGGTSGTSSLAITNPVPAITGVSPSSIATGGTGATVTITGTGFLPSTALQVNGAARATTVTSGTQVTFALTTADLASINTLSLTLSNPAPGGGTSNAATVQVGVPAPTITSLSPASVPVGSPATTVTINGTGFLSSTTVQFNGVTRTNATFVSSTQMTLPLAAADLTYSGNDVVAVTNPAASGGSSRTATFTVQAATPVLTAITPNTLATNSGGNTITATGSNFTSSSKLLWNGTQIPTAYNSSPTYGSNGIATYNYVLLGTVSADLLSAPGTASVTVSTPTATAVSNALTVTISNPPVPVVTSLSPSAVPTNADVKLTLTGTGFAKTSVVSYNGLALPTTFNSNTGLSVTVPAASLAFPGNGAITVSTPAPGGGTSTGIPLTVYVPLVSNSMVFNPVNGLAYLSIPSSGSTVAGNSIVSFDPATGALGTPIFIGSEPGVMAVSDDGTTLWVALNGTTAIRKVDLVHATAGPQYSVSALASYSGTSIMAILVLPGTTGSVAVTNGSTLAIYDAGVLRGSTVSVSSTYALQADGTRNELYAGGYALQAYTYGTSGLTLKSSGNNNYSNTVASSNFDEMQLVGGKMFTDMGRVYDPESGGQLGTFAQAGVTVTGPTLDDTALSQVYVLTNPTSPGFSAAGYSEVNLYSPADYSNTGKSFAWNIPAYITTGSGSTLTSSTLTPHRLSRWGANGLILHTKYAIFTAESNVIKDQSGVSADLSISLTASGGTTTGSTATYTATVQNAGPQPATDVAVSLVAPSTGLLTGTTSSVGACPSATGCTLGTLASGASATITVQVLQTTAGTGTLTAQVQGSSADPSGSNNAATSSVVVTGATYNLSPTLLSLTPNAVKAGSTDTTITVTGANFASGSQVMLGTTALATTFVNSTQLTATVPAANLTAMTWSPVSVSTPAPGGGGSTSLPFTVFNVVTVGLNHIVYEPYSRKLYASVSSGSSAVTGSSIVSIDPATGTFGTPVAFASAPNLLAVSSSGNTIYTTLTVPSNTTVQNVPMGRLDTVQGTSSSFAIVVPNFYTGFPVEGVLVQPGTENTLAISRTNAYATIYDYNPSSNALTARSATGNYYAGTCIAFLDATHLLSTYSSTVDYTVSASGLTNSGNFTSPSECFQLSGSTALTDTGKLYTLTNSGATQAGTLALPNSYSSLQPAVDASLDAAFFAANTSSSSYGTVDGLISYDLRSDLRSGLINLGIPTIEGSGSSTTLNDMIRWGQDGLAMVTSTGHLYLLRGPFVVPQELGANTAATLASSSATTVAAGSGNTLLQLTGTNFQPGVAVTWNGSYRTTTIVDANHVTVAIPASDLAAAGSATLVATNPGATASNTLTVTVH